MHTVNNTNTDIIRENCKADNAADKENNCVLIITGSLNPIHCSHIRNLQLVKEYLENHTTRPLHVLAAYLSPTHDSYVRSKLGVSDWIPADNRSKLCEEAIEHEKLASLVSVAKGEFQHRTFVDFDEVTMQLAEFLNSELCGPDKLLKHPLKVVYICGLDHFNKCSHVEQLSREKNIACAVIYRLGARDNHIKTLIDKSSNIYYIPLEDEREKLVDISSTAIRQQYRNPTNTNVDETIYPAVAKYLQDKYKKQ